MSGIEERVWKLEKEVSDLRKLVEDLMYGLMFKYAPQPLQVHAPQPYQPYVSPYADTTTAEPPFPIFEDDLIPASERVEEPPAKSPRATYYAKIAAKTSDSSLG